jgi:hypothetical protein
MFCVLYGGLLLVCRERLIHLLAVRPYKKPELYDRIIKGTVYIFSYTETTERILMDSKGKCTHSFHLSAASLQFPCA